MTIIPIQGKSIDSEPKNVNIKFKSKIKKIENENLNKNNNKEKLSINLNKNKNKFRFNINFLYPAVALFILVFISILYSKVDNFTYMASVSNVNLPVYSYVLQKDISQNNIIDIPILIDFLNVKNKDYIRFNLVFDTNYLELLHNYTDEISNINLYKNIIANKIDMTNDLAVWEFEADGILDGVDVNKNILTVLNFRTLKKGTTNIRITVFDKNDKILGVYQENININ